MCCEGLSVYNQENIMISKNKLCDLIPHQRMKSRVKASAHTKTYSYLRRARDSFDWTKPSSSLAICHRAEVVARISSETEQ